MTRIQIKRGTAASWASANPILSQGEMGYEIDTKMMKVGDGATPWSSLVYSSIGNFGVGSFTQTVGDGSATTITVTHNLNTRNVVVSVKESSTYAEVLCDVSATSANAVTLTFAAAPTAGQYIVTVIGDNVPVALANTLPFLDNAFILRDATDPTKQARFSTSAITTGMTRTYVLPDANATLVGTAATQTLTDKTLTSPVLTTPVIDGASTGTGVSVTGTASTLALRDANANLSANNHIEGFTSTVTANGTTPLTAASTKIQEFTGSANQTLVLPSTGIVAGQQFMAINNSTGSINTQASGSGVVHVLGPNIECLFTALVSDPTLPEHWEDSFYGANFAAGKVLNVNTSLTLAGTDGTTFTFPATNDTVVGIAATQSLSNKTLVAPTITSATFTGRITPRIGTTASSATPSIDINSFDQYNITALAAAITGVTVTGTPTDGQKLLVRIRDNGTARAITWGSSFMASGASPLLTTTVISKTHLVGFIYDAVAAKFVCVASDATGY